MGYVSRPSYHVSVKGCHPRKTPTTMFWIMIIILKSCLRICFFFFKFELHQEERGPIGHQKIAKNNGSCFWERVEQSFEKVNREGRGKECRHLNLTISREVSTRSWEKSWGLLKEIITKRVREGQSWTIPASSAIIIFLIEAYIRKIKENKNMITSVDCHRWTLQPLTQVKKRTLTTT